MAINQYYTFAGSLTANSLTNSAYASLTTLRSDGFQPGVALSEQVNTVLRQTSTVSAAVAELSRIWSLADSLDNGNAGTLAAQLEAAIRAIVNDQAIPAGIQARWEHSPTPPPGWLECFGQTLLQSAYPRLYAAIGTIHGTAGAGTFKLPDWRGDTMRGWDHARGVDPGRLLPSEQLDAVQDFTGSFGIDDGQTGTLSGAFVLGAGNGNGMQQSGPGYQVNLSLSAAGVRTATETRMRNRTTLVIIKT